MTKRTNKRYPNDFKQENEESALSTDERAELIQLRKDKKRLEMEREILKKASAFFAKEMK
jgi:transposase